MTHGENPGDTASSAVEQPVVDSLSGATRAVLQIAEQVKKVADTLAGASTEARTQVAPYLDGTVVAQRWPLRAHSLKALFRGRMELALAAVAGPPVEFRDDSPLENSSFLANEIGDAYPESTNPHLAFSLDIVRWGEAMNDAGHNVVVAVDLGKGDGSVGVHVYDDSEALRALFDQQVARPIAELEHYEWPRQWVSPHTIMEGSTPLVEAVNAAFLAQQTQSE